MSMRHRGSQRTSMDKVYTPLEHYLPRLVAYLARLQSVTQNTKDLLKVYTKLELKILATHVFQNVPLVRIAVVSKSS